jgi:glycerol-3-phosphate acyltransferase PlsY
LFQEKSIYNIPGGEMKIFLIYVISYLIGAIPVGYIIGKNFYHIDITKYGSGNIGMANVQRVLGNKAAFVVFILDSAEGAIPALLTLYVLKSPYLALTAGIISVFSHDHSIFLKGFKGGKGVATSFGVVLVISPITALIAVAIFVLIVWLTKYTSLASIISGILYPIILFIITGDTKLTLISIALVILLIIAHRENIKRLIKGTERKIGQRVKIDERH